TVTVSGTCSEVVNITDFENLTLTGTAGAGISWPTSGPTAAPISVGNSKNIRITGFLVEGNNVPRPVVNIFDSTADIQNCTIRDGGDATHFSNGVQVGGVSRVRIGAATIHDNSGNGVSANDTATVYIGLTPADPI